MYLVFLKKDLKRNSIFVNLMSSGLDQRFFLMGMFLGGTEIECKNEEE